MRVKAHAFGADSCCVTTEVKTRWLILNRRAS
jgi:hypothetical protein